MNKNPIQIASEEYVADFPFIEHWVRQYYNSLRTITVKRLDLEALQRVAELFYLFFFTHWTQIICVSKDKKIMCEAQFGGTFFHITPWWAPWRWKICKVVGHSALDTLMGLNEQDLARVGYVLMVTGIDNGSVNIIIYKLPKDRTLSEFVDDEKARIKSEARVEIAREASVVR